MGTHDKARTLRVTLGVATVALAVLRLDAASPAFDVEELQRAEQGDADAQFNLGVMYTRGEGVPRDAAAAVSWYRKAAEQGHAGAQFNLALMYDRGEGVPQDYVRAYAWMNVAAARGHEEARKHREMLAEVMSRAQIAEAQVLSRDLNGRLPRR